MIHSSAQDKRCQKRIERELKSERMALEKKCDSICKLTYYYRADAEAASEVFLKINSNYYNKARQKITKIIKLRSTNNSYFRDKR